MDETKLVITEYIGDKKDRLSLMTELIEKKDKCGSSIFATCGPIVRKFLGFPDVSHIFKLHPLSKDEVQIQIPEWTEMLNDPVAYFKGINLDPTEFMINNDCLPIKYNKQNKQISYSQWTKFLVGIYETEQKKNVV